MVNFNSIKVQLEQPQAVGQLIATNRFQFHKGTIRTCCLACVVRSHDHFNSIKVQLELPLPLDQHEQQRNFNSIKVQLEQIC